MSGIAGLVGVILAIQVPPPSTATESARPLRLERLALLDRESKALQSLAEAMEKKDQPESAAEVRRLIPPKPPAPGVRRFVPLPEVDVPPLLASDSKPKPEIIEARKAAVEIRETAATALFALATRAATEQPRFLAIADACLREVLQRQPDHPEARRLLGFVPHHGGWATPFAVQQFELGNILHPVYGWVPRSWVPELENGMLPGRTVNGEPPSWLPAAKADALRRKYPTGWRIDTEHFHIQTNVPLSETIAFGRNLEHLHELFESHFADVIGDDLPLARRFRSKSAVANPSGTRHDISYFASRREFNDFLRPYEGAGISRSLGLYYPPGILPRSSRGHAFFFRDATGDLPVTATLHHEVSHQLLWESGVAGAEDYLGNDGNYWVFEGLGTYFETLVPLPDGSLAIGGLTGARKQEARATLTQPGKLVPLDRFVRMDKRAFNHRVDIYRHYQQASALVSYLLHGEGEVYRESFLEYVRDAARGKVRGTSGLSLEERLGRPLAEVEAGFLEYLKKP